MGLLGRLRRAKGRPGRSLSSGVAPQARRSAVPGHHSDPRETELWERLREDPNDAAAFAELADLLQRRAPASQPEEGPDRTADDAVWSLAEELAHSPRAWYPLVELARLSIADDRDSALRRLGTAADREPGGHGLQAGISMLREEGLPGDAVNLATGHWRPREHGIETARQVIEASIEAGRIGDARRYLQAISNHPDSDAAEQLRDEMAPLVDRAEARLPARTPPGGVPLINLDQLREASSRNPFRRH